MTINSQEKNRAHARQAKKRPRNGAASGPTGDPPSPPAAPPPSDNQTASILDSLIRTLKNNPYLASLVIVFIFLNALLGVFDRVLSLLPRLGLSQNVDEAAREYAMLLAISGAVVASLYYITLTIIRFNKNREGALNSLFAKCGIFEHTILYEVLPIGVSCIFLNFAGFVLNRSLGDLFFFDTLGTFLAAFLLGPYWAGCVGLLTNVSMMTVSKNAFLWGGIHALLGILWGFIAKKSPNLLHKDGSRLRPLAGRVAIFLIPSVLLSSYAVAVIKTSIYNPKDVDLNSESLWVIQRFILNKLYVPQFISLQNAYFLGDLTRNFIDKLLIIIVGVLMLAARSLKLKKEFGQEIPGTDNLFLPVGDRGRGANLVFTAFFIVFLYFLLPYEYVLDRANNVQKQVSLGFGSWFFLSLPLYIALLDLIFHPEADRCVIDRSVAKNQRKQTYLARFSRARGEGLTQWVMGGVAAVWVALAVYFLCLWAISLTGMEGAQTLPTSKTTFSFISVGAGLTALVILRFLGGMEKD